MILFSFQTIDGKRNIDFPLTMDFGPKVPHYSPGSIMNFDLNIDLAQAEMLRDKYKEGLQMSRLYGIEKMETTVGYSVHLEFIIQAVRHFISEDYRYQLTADEHVAQIDLTAASARDEQIFIDLVNLRSEKRTAGV